MNKEEKRKEKFQELLKNAGYKSLHDFAIKTRSPYTGKKRSSTGIRHHFANPPSNIKVLLGYANDLNVEVYEIMNLFDIKLENDFNFEDFLLSNGFQSSFELNEKYLDKVLRLISKFSVISADDKIFSSEKYVIVIRHESTLCLDKKLEHLAFLLPFKVESLKLAKKLIK